MKTVKILIFFLSPALVFPQAKIKIDTLKVNYHIKDVVDVTSFIPQISGEINAVAKAKINAGIRECFMADIPQDSAAYVKNLLEENGAKDVTDYLKKIEQQEIYAPSDENESFEITYISDNLLNFTYSYNILPQHGQLQYFFKSIVFDLRTGNRLKFDDFLSIENKDLLSLFKREGYTVSWRSDPDDPVTVIPVDPNDEYIEKNLNGLFEAGDPCIEFYFRKMGNGVHLMFKFSCAGPILGDYGISLTKLLPYIKYYEFKNTFKLWGKDVNAIKGVDYLTLGDQIEFDDYTMTNSGSGYLLHKDNMTKDEFGIAIGHSPTKMFYIFLKYQTTNNDKKATILDILEIHKEALTTDTKLTEYCETKKGADTEIIALVKNSNNNPAYYTKIIKAWRANRKTDKFEIINKKMVKRCGKESYGI